MTFYEMQMEFIGYIKSTEKKWFLALMAMSACALLGTAYAIATASPFSSRLSNTLGLLLTLAGIVQLEISGLFEKLSEIFSDYQKYPSGPPSYYCREAIQDPDGGAIETLKALCFFNLKTGFYLIIAGTLTQLVAVWI